MLHPPPPRYATPRDPRFATYGPQIAATAKLMGTPLLPWQMHAADLIGECHPDGRFHHTFVVITVPRQAGKTTLVLAVAVHRALYQAQRRVWYTAQTGKYARDKWGEMADTLELSTSPIRPLIRKGRAKRTNGDEQLAFINGSTLNPHPPTRDGLHSKQSDLNLIDEGWAHDALAGEALMGAITPTQTTRPQRQTIVLSTAGDARSEWFHALVDRGLAGDPTIALIDYGAPKGTDPEDHETIAAHHPAFGLLTDMAALHDARGQMSPSEYLRAYGNLRTGAADRAIPAGPWGKASTDVVSTDAPAFGVAVSEDRSLGSIWAGWLLADGRLLVELVDRRPGTAWMVDRMVELNGTHTPRVGFAADPLGPAGGVVDAYRLAMTKRGTVKTDRPPVLPMTRTDYAAACGETFDRITDPAGPRWLWRPDEDGALDAAADVADKLRVGDGAFVWGRRASGGTIADLEAATLAGFAALRAPRPTSRPRIVSFAG